MHRYKVEIVHKGRVVYSCVVSAVSSKEAKDQAWRTYDRDQVTSIGDLAYATTAEEL